MEASMASEMSVKSDQNEPLQLHSMPPWKRYESEEEDVSETSSQSVFSPTEGEISNESDADESVSEAGSIDTEMLAPVYHKVSSDDSSSLYSHRLSIITAKRSSTATCVPNDYGRDASTADDNGDVSPCTEYMTPPLSPIYLSALCYVPDGSESSSREEESANAEDNDEDEAHEAEWHEVSEAKQVFFTAPASRPNIVMIQSLTTEAILTARMGNPIQLQQFTEQNSLSLNTRPLNLRKRPSTKRSSSALELTTTPDRSKRFSAMFFHDFTQNGETAYFDSRNPTRAYASPGSRTGSSRMDSSVSNTTNSSEPRQSRLRRNPSLRSSSRSSRYAPEYQSPPNYSRPRSIRSSSVASDMTSGSSASWRRVQTYNWSSTSLQYPSSSSPVADRPSSSSSSPSPGENEPSRPTPHPLSIITTSTSPTTASPPQPQSAITSHSSSSSSDIDWSPVVEYRQSSTTPNQKTVPYSRLHNPSLSVSLATATEVLDPSRSRARSGSMTPSPVATTPTTRKSSISAVMPAAAAATSSKSSANHSNPTSTMKLLMGGFRGLGKQRTRQA